MLPFSDTANLKPWCLGDCMHSGVPPPYPQEYLTFDHFHFAPGLLGLNQASWSGIMAVLPPSASLKMPCVRSVPLNAHVKEFEMKFLMSVIFICFHSLSVTQSLPCDIQLTEISAPKIILIYLTYIFY